MIRLPKLASVVQYSLILSLHTNPDAMKTFIVLDREVGDVLYIGLSHTTNVGKYRCGTSRPENEAWVSKLRQKSERKYPLELESDLNQNQASSQKRLLKLLLCPTEIKIHGWSCSVLVKLDARIYWRQFYHKYKSRLARNEFAYAAVCRCCLDVQGNLCS